MSNEMEQQRVGIITRTLIQSPSTKQLLHARIRSWNQNDVIFVGDDFIHVKEIGIDGHLQHVATKSDFDARIHKAVILSTGLDQLSEAFPVKQESGESLDDGTSMPPQLLVLTLDSNDLIFVYMTTTSDGSPRFSQQVCPMPAFDRALFQPGEHLAVDHRSRALAIAANQREVVLFSAKPKDHFRHQLKTGEKDWCPVDAQRPFQIDGYIQNMEFLIPSSGNADHIILLLIVIDQRKTKAIWVDWYATSGLQHARVHPAQSLESATGVPSLLIPLQNAAFMTINGNEFKRWKNILSGSVSGIILESLDMRPMYAGNSPRKPVWASWCRPPRGPTFTRDKDHVYLIREDGLAFLVQISEDDSIQSSCAGDFECHVGTAFTSLGDDISPDILAVAGEMSSGRISSIGHWPRSRVSDLSWNDTMEMDLIETIPNWASVTDMIVSTLPQSQSRSTKSRDGILVTSGRQPYGTITELRKGWEASLALYFELDGLKSVTDAWTLLLASSESVLLLLTSPSSTRLINIPIDVEQISEIDADETSAFDTAHRTIAAGSTPDGRIIQVTEQSIYVSASLMGNFEDTVKRTCDEGSVIIAAAIHLPRSIVITARRTAESSSLQCERFAASDELAASENQQWTDLKLENEPSAMVLVQADPTTLLVAVATTDSKLRLISIQSDGTMREINKATIPSSDDEQGICDYIVGLTTSLSERVLLACGLRDGRIYSITVDFDEDSEVTFGQDCVIPFSNSTVKLTQLPVSTSTAYAMSGLDTCSISWDGTSASKLSIENIWISDKFRPELGQSPVLACARMPSANDLASTEIAGCLVMVSPDELLIASVNTSSNPVPRQIPVTGTPNRLLYAEQHRSLVCASLRTEMRNNGTTSPGPEDKRQIFPAIDFIPSRSSMPSFTYDMQPGERVYSLLEWSFKLGDEKTYSFIMVGGSYTRSSGTIRGKVTFLQPKIRNWEITNVKEGKSTNFDAPVYALALYDDLTYVACSGQQVILHRFVVDRRWEQVCPPYKLASPGVFVTVNKPFIHITTAEDSLITLRLDETDGTASLVVANTAPQAAASLSHLVLDSDPNLALITTKSAQILGLSTPTNEQSTTHSTSSQILFKVQLPHSLTRLRTLPTRPRWRYPPPAGLIATPPILGSAPNGALMGIALLSEPLWRRLAWLQRLCEWSEHLSPRSWQSAPYVARDDAEDDDGEFARYVRALPAGAKGADGDEILLRTSVEKSEDWHIDGDVLARVLAPGGLQALKDVVKFRAEKGDAVGRWLAGRVEEEMNDLEELIALLPGILDCWL